MWVKGDATREWITKYCVKKEKKKKKITLEKEMATCSSVLAWKILWTEEPGGLKSMGLQRVGCDLAYQHIL